MLITKKGEVSGMFEAEYYCKHFKDPPPLL